MATHADRPPRTFRLTCRPGERAGVLALLEAQGFRSEPEPFHPAARRLAHEPAPLGDSLAARFGLIYIQDRSSMLPPLVLDPPDGAIILDMCASPGSKTGLAALLAGEDGMVLAVEPNRSRLATLRANLARTSTLTAATANYESDALPLPDGSFSHILLDPPCSGWGVTDRHPSTTRIWKKEKIAPLTALQRRLLASAARLLAPGGTMTYSTCTTNPDENEAQVRHAVEDLGLVPDPVDGVAGFDFARPKAPDMDGMLKVDGPGPQGQGFFVARLKKPGAPAGHLDPGLPTALPGTRMKTASLPGQGTFDWPALARGHVFRFGERLFFLPGPAPGLLPGGFRWQGCPLGRMAGGKFAPDPWTRSLVPDVPGREAAVLEDVRDLAGLLAGQSLTGPQASGKVALYYRDLALGWLTAKGRRLLWSGK